MFISIGALLFFLFFPVFIIPAILIAIAIYYPVALVFIFAGWLILAALG